MTDPWIPAFVGVAGLALGSYAVTTGIRISRAEGTLRGRSHCDDCGVQLSFAHTIPLVSYVRSGGHCAACGSLIDPLHLAGELAGAVVLATAASVGYWRAAPLAILGLCLITLAAVDIRVQRLPNLLCLAVALAGGALAWNRGPEALLFGFIMGGALVVILLGLRWLSARGARDPGLGLGDVKLLAALSLWLGLYTPWALGGAGAGGVLLWALSRGFKRRIAFGPYLSVAAWVVGMGMELGWWRMP